MEMEGEESRLFEVNEAGKIVFKKGKYAGETLDEVRLTSRFYLLYLRFRARGDVDRKILKEVLAGKEEREIHEKYFAEDEG